MSASVMKGESELSSLRNGVTVLHVSDNSNSSKDSLDLKIDQGLVEELKIVETPEPETPKVPAMAFTIDFGANKGIDNKRLENLAKKSQARHQRVQSMSASWHKSSPSTPAPPQKPPLSVKLPRKSHGYSSEGYFSSDQEDSILSNSVKLNKSAQNDLRIKPHKNTSCSDLYQARSPIVDKEFKFLRQTPKIISKESVVNHIDGFKSRQHLKLPLKHSNNSLYSTEAQKNVNYPNTSTHCIKYNNLMDDILDQSPDDILLADISSPEFDILTPDNSNDIFSKFSLKTDMNDQFEKESNSSAGTYTIEGDNYTEEQKARMSIDRNIHKNTEIILEKYTPNKLSSFQRSNNCKDNVLEISCYHQQPLADDLTTQTAKQIKSTRSYLDKIRSRVRTISEKTFQKCKNTDSDMGQFTSVTASGVFGGSNTKSDECNRKNSLTKAQVDNSEYIHRLPRESSVPLIKPFESTVLRRVQDSDNIGERLSFMSLNRCRGDNNWIEQWAESAKLYTADDLVSKHDSSSSSRQSNCSSNPLLTRRPVSKGSTSPRTPVKDIHSTLDTNKYLNNTQNAITKLQAKLTQSSSKLPVSQLTRSNSLTYKLRKKDTEKTPRCVDPTPLSPNSERNYQTYRKTHTRNHSFDGRNSNYFNSSVNLKDVLLNNAFESKFIDQSRHHGNSTRNIKRSNSHNTSLYSQTNEPFHTDSDSNVSPVSPARRIDAPNNSPRRAAEFKRSDGGARFSVRVTSKEKQMSPQNCTQGLKLDEAARLSIINRLTKPRAVSKDNQPKAQVKKLSQHKSSSSLAPTTTQNKEFTNWKKRSSYDPMKSAMEGKRRQQQLAAERRNKEGTITTTCVSSPVQRSQSFHSSTNLTDNYSSDNEDMSQPNTMMITSIHSDLAHVRPNIVDFRRRAAVDVDSTGRDYVTAKASIQPALDKRKTFILEDMTPTNENIEYLTGVTDITQEGNDKRRTFLLESDTNSSSPRNSSVFSHDKSLTNTSDTENESTGETQVVLRNTARGNNHVLQQKRNSAGDYSVSSSTNSLSQCKRSVQPKYLDISKYKDTNAKTYLKRDPSKAYALPTPGKGSARQIQLEQKTKELEKWKRRASYDPRKAAAAGKQQTTSNVLRSQSFHGPMLNSSLHQHSFKTNIMSGSINEAYDTLSDNDF